MVRWRQCLRVLTGMALLAGLAVVHEEAGAAGKMYWIDDGRGTITDKIQRANLDGTGVQNLVVTGLSGPSGIALDVVEGKMYWIDDGFDRIQRANLDGSRVEVLVQLVGGGGREPRPKGHRAGRGCREDVLD